MDVKVSSITIASSNFKKGEVVGMISERSNFMEGINYIAGVERPGHKISFLKHHILNDNGKGVHPSWTQLCKIFT